jgi:hypothetical protein
MLASYGSGKSIGLDIIETGTLRLSPARSYSFSSISYRC